MAKKLWTLFSSVFYIASCTFGGGYVIIPLMQKRFVDELNWIDEEEMLDLVAIAQSTPGSVAVNASILIGFKVAGVIGAIVTIFGTIMPPIMIISVISMFYEAFKTNVFVSVFLRGMQAGVCAVIFDVVIRLATNILKAKEPMYILLMVLAFTGAVIFDVNVIYIILFCGIAGLIEGFLVSKEVKLNVT